MRKRNKGVKEVLMKRHWWIQGDGLEYCTGERDPGGWWRHPAYHSLTGRDGWPWSGWLYRACADQAAVQVEV